MMATERQRDLRDGLLSVLAPGEAVTKLGVCKLVQSTCGPDAEVTPDVFTTAEVQLLHSA